MKQVLIHTNPMWIIIISGAIFNNACRHLKAVLYLYGVNPNVNVNLEPMNAPSNNSWHKSPFVTSACSGVMWPRLEHRGFSTV